MKKSFFDIAAWGLCGVSGFFLLMTMLLSAAGMQDETRMMFILTIVFAVLSFCMVHVGRALAEDEKAPASPAESSDLLQQAVEAMERWEASDAPEDWTVFQEKARKALLSLGEVSLSPRNQAVAAVSEAITARRAAMEEPDEELRPMLIRTAEAQALHAFRLFRKAMDH
jgi:hypothetical protein